MKKPIISFIFLLTVLSVRSYSLPLLNSLPTAKATIYLDFSGYNVDCGVWNGGIPFTCAAPLLTDAQITESFNRVSEDYRPFNINITTDSTVYLAAPLTQRIRVVITPTSSWYPGVSGVSFIGSFTWGDETPCFVFSDRLGPNNPKMIGECCSHESGHSLGLFHQSSFDDSCNLVSVYNEGTGNGEIGWAPIMGNSFNKNMTSWNNGPTPFGCVSIQDNLSIITTQNGFTYRTDDFSDDINIPTVINPFNINVDGLISTTTDKDAFKFNLSRTSGFHLDATPFNVGSGNNGANVDLRIQLFDANKKILNTFDPANTMSVTLDTVLSSGDYYLLVDGAGNSNATDYNSIGSYKLRSNITVLPVRSIILSGTNVNSGHHLNWKIVSDEPLKSCIIEFSTDGISFKELHSVATSAMSYSYIPTKEDANIFYRLKVTSVNDQLFYSNAICIKPNEKTNKTYFVTTLVQNNITVNASSNFSYLFMNMNGQMITRGIGLKGLNKINISNQPKGMYILQLTDNKNTHTERIIK